MNCYIVTREGVYRHDMYGPFHSAPIAERAARWLAAHDSDGYHTWDVTYMDGLGESEHIAEYAQEDDRKSMEHPNAIRVPKQDPRHCNGTLPPDWDQSW